VSEFKQNVKRDLNDPQLRDNFRGAMDYLMDKRQAAFSDEKEWVTLREQCKQIKQRCLLKLPHLLEQLEENLQRNGIEVHWAETTEQANEIIAGLIAKEQGKEALIWQLWALVHKSPRLYRLSTKLLTRLSWLMAKNLGPWTVARTAPKPAVKTLHELIAEREKQGKQK
jgi:hypothetical protein